MGVDFLIALLLKVACFPEQVTQFDFLGRIDSLRLEFSEKVRVSFLQEWFKLKFVTFIVPSFIAMFFKFLHVQIHINMIVLEARLQAELLYAFRALIQYMKQ